MLSPHEFSTLMLVNTAADQIDPTRPAKSLARC
jgi:hypothetical protein